MRGKLASRLFMPKTQCVFQQVQESMQDVGKDRNKVQEFLWPKGNKNHSIIFLGWLSNCRLFVAYFKGSLLAVYYSLPV